jgi:hypothetical protein
MKNICTVSDSNYLTKGLALYESLKHNTENIVLHYLCVDESAYNKLKQFESNSLKVYSVNDYINNDSALLDLKKQDYRYFCWALASYFTNKLVKEFDSITYIDADIYFHLSFDYVLNEIADREIGLFRHRQFPLSANRPEGLYNVGVVYFKNTDIGSGLCSWWAESVLHKRHNEYATCGDQKYLEYFAEVCPKDLIYIDENIGHGAPWQWQLYEFIDKDKIKWGEQVQNLVFTHFSQFVDNGDSYTPSTMHHIYTPIQLYFDLPALKQIYDEYYNKLKETIIDYGL